MISPPEWRQTQTGDWAHAVRYGHTLCGRKPPLPTLKALPNAKRCTGCLFVPDGHAMHLDMTSPTGPIRLTYRQLDYWSRNHWLHAHIEDVGQGYRRTWAPPEQTVARLMRIYVRHAKLRPGTASHAARNNGLIAPGIHIVIDPEILNA